MSAKIVVLGSTNTDMVIKAGHLPNAGETILGGTFFMNPGGKGANQAVAAARLGGKVLFISKTGNDVFGKQNTELFEKEGIDTSYIFQDPNEPSGVALITVDSKAENCIVVASGANATLLPADVSKAAAEIETAAILLTQLETPIETIVYAAGIAAAKNVRVILNPAPACPIPKSLLKGLYMITPNRIEAEMLTGIKVEDTASAKLAAEALHTAGVQIVIITLGAQGALSLIDNVFHFIEAEKVEPVDTTAAGDVFNGALAVAIAEGAPVLDAIKFAGKAAAISVTRLGAQASAPYKREIAL
jgi:ribokinase